jgi:hypothetical protein
MWSMYNPRVADDRSEGSTKGSAVGGTVKYLLSAVTVGLLSFFGSLIWRSFEKIEESQASIGRRLDSLEQDKSKWATLAELDREVTQLRIQVEVMRQVWSYEYNRNVPTGFPRPGNPVLMPPEELFRDVDIYKNLLQQKYPSKK